MVPWPASSAAGLTCSSRSTERVGTKEGFTAEAAGRCITLRLRGSVWRGEGGWVGLVSLVNISSSGRGHLWRCSVELLIREQGHMPASWVVHWRTTLVYVCVCGEYWDQQYYCTWSTQLSLCSPSLWPCKYAGDQTWNTRVRQNAYWFKCSSLYSSLNDCSGPGTCPSTGAAAFTFYYVLKCFYFEKYRTQ